MGNLTVISYSIYYGKWGSSYTQNRLLFHKNTVKLLVINYLNPKIVSTGHGSHESHQYNKELNTHNQLSSPFTTSSSKKF